MNTFLKHSLPLWLVPAQMILVFAPTVIWLLERWTMSIWHHGHGILILLAVIYLIWTELKEHRQLPASTSAGGFAILIPALAIRMLDMGINSQLLSAFSLFLSLPGLSLLFLGKERTKAIIFPLIILFLTLPIPLFFTESVHLFLRKIAAINSAFLLPYFGVPVFLQETTLFLPNGALQVADACSGFSTLYAAVTIACLVAYYCPDNRRRTIIMVLTVPLSIAVNTLRIVLLCLMVHWVGLDVLKTMVHEISGLLTFAIVIPIIVGLGLGNAPIRSKATP